MIRIVQFIKRAPGLDRSQLQTFLRDQHGPLMSGLSTTLGFRKHVISFANIEDLPEGPRGPLEEPFDAAWEIWFDHEDILEGRLKNPYAAEAFASLMRHREGYVDPMESPIWVAHEYPQINPCPEKIVADRKSHIVKICFALSPAPDLGDIDAQRHWRVHHGPLVRSYAPVTCMKKYIQVHRDRGPLDDQVRSLFGARERNYMGHVEAWFDRRDDAGATAARGDAARDIIADERLYADFTKSSQFEGKEIVFTDFEYA